MMLLRWLFDCRHVRYSWPRTDKRTKVQYVACLDCGRRFRYQLGAGFVRRKAA